MSDKYKSISGSIDELKSLLNICSDSELARILDLTRQDINQLRKSTKIDPKTKIISLLLNNITKK